MTRWTLDPSLLTEHLASTEERIAQGERRLISQRQLIYSLDVHNLDSAMARDLLKTFEETQELRHAEARRLRAELASAQDRARLG